MNSPLPDNVLPLVAFDAPGRASTEAPEDRFARLVHGMTGQAVRHELSSVQVVSLLAAASRMPVNPNARIATAGIHTDAPEQKPLLSYVLSRTPAYESRRAHREWPATLAGFTQDLLLGPGPQPEDSRNAEEEGFRDKVDVEWFAAVLLAAGADPWAHASDSNPWGSALTEVLKHNLSGLLHRMLTMPGAPAAQEVLDGTFHSPGGNRSDPWCSLLTRDPKYTAVFEVLLRHKARLPTDPRVLVDLLGNASLGAIQALQAHAALPMDEAIQKRIKTQWRARGKRASQDKLTPEMLAALLAALDHTGTVDSEQERQVAEIADLISNPGWGDTGCAYREDPCHNTFKSNTGAARLCARTVLSRGAMAGQWSGLAGMALHRLRMSGPDGVTPWRMEAMVSWGFKDGIWKTLEPIADGALSLARGFDWRPGIAIDGLLVLVILGMKQERSGDALLQAHQEKEYADLQQQAQRLLRVTSLGAWGQQNAAAAVAWTEHLLARPTPKVVSIVEGAWRQVMETAPHLFDRDPASVVRLLRAFHGKFTVNPFTASAVTKGHRCSSVSRWDPWLVPLGLSVDPKLARWATLTTIQKEILLEVALLSETQDWLSSLTAAAEQRIFSPQDLGRMRMVARLVDQRAATEITTGWTRKDAAVLRALGLDQALDEGVDPLIAPSHSKVRL